MSKVESKPLIIVDQYAEVKQIFADLKAENAPLMEEVAKTIDKLRALKIDQNTIMENHWKRVKDILLKEGFIDSKDVCLSLRDGVIYLDPAPTGLEDMRIILSKFLGDGSFEL